MMIPSISLIPGFRGKVNEYTSISKTMQNEVFNSQPIKPKGCQPLRPLEYDTFVKSSKEASPKSDPQDTFVRTSKPDSEKVKTPNPFVKTPEQQNSVQEFLVSNKPGSNVSFGYKHALKTAWKKGLLPTVTKGLYGNELTRANISLEHITPVSQGGKTILENLALADRTANMQRGIKPIADVISFKQLMEYLEQFRDVRVKGLNGNRYIKKMLEKAVKEWHFNP